eukprot:TRINITY_DN18557_c0_g1_i1.p1 TRINITY_DN18557_c0_g1~~TRINITY_DN18557_c0_g1_i1.p1  ORF type:complete len:229 (-),score=23.94 TRINITY_DN18557_c0_g1_i1:33-719(-)
MDAFACGASAWPSSYHPAAVYSPTARISRSSHAGAAAAGCCHDRGEAWRSAAIAATATFGAAAFWETSRGSRRQGETGLRSSRTDVATATQKRTKTRRPYVQKSRRHHRRKVVAVSPQRGELHQCTLIYLHGFRGDGMGYLDTENELSFPWRLGEDYAPGLRAVLPSAPELRQPWGEVEPAWYVYENEEDAHIEAASLPRVSQLVDVGHFASKHLCPKEGKLHTNGMS